MLTQEQISQSLQELSDASFHLKIFAEKSHVPDELGARVTEMADLMDDMEEHFYEHGDRQIEEEDQNAGFDQIMDADITSMLAALTVKFK